MQTTIVFLLVISFLVFVHELGHFIVALWCRVRVNTFAIGFPPTIWQKKYRGIDYKLNAIPFGGYVSMHGEESTENNDPQAFRSRPWWQQVAVLLAGVTMNFLVAVIIFSGLNVAGTYEPTENTNTPVTVIQLLPDSPADSAGITVGDTIQSLQIGTTVLDHPSPEMITASIESSMGKSITITVAPIDNIKNTRQVILNAREETGENTQYHIGVGLGYVELVHYGLIGGIANGFSDAVHMTGQIFRGLGKMITDLATTGHAPDVSGPIGIARIVGGAANDSIVYLLRIVAVLSLNLAVLNVLPFPALDGGQIVLVLIDKIRRKPLSQKIVSYVNGFGFSFLILLMIIVTIKDVFK